MDQDCKTPGQLIKKLLDARGWHQRILAIVLDADESGINKIISGNRQVTAEMALLLGEVFDVQPERFLDLQKSYDLAKAKIISQPDPSRATRASLFGDLPVIEMIKRGWLDVENVRDVKKTEAALSKFFGVDSVNEIEILPHAAKKTNVSTSATPAQIAWIYRVREIASEMLVPSYRPDSMNNVIEQLRNLTSAPEEARKVPRILTEAGIRFVIVESLPSAKIDGVCFWLNNKSPVIGMSLRYDRIDNFWFVLRHEIEHVIRLDGLQSQTIILDTELEGERGGMGENVATQERIANKAAAEFCVPQEKIERFIARKSPYFAERDILGFANTLQIHPGLVAGRLQRETGRYDRFRNHLAKIRTHVSPSAMTDGWGDIYPIGL